MKDPHDIRKAAIEDAIIARPEEAALPSVAGRMEMTHADFQRGCMVLLAEAQTHINPETFLIQLLCEAVRCSRECCDIATVRPDANELAQLRAKCERLEAEAVMINNRREELRAKVHQLEAQSAQMREAWDELVGMACEFIGPDEDNKPECTCCGMSLETVSKGHKSDCLAQGILLRAEQIQKTTTAGTAILARLEEARRLLEGAIPGMDSCPHIYQAEMWIQRRDQWLKGQP